MDPQLCLATLLTHPLADRRRGGGRFDRLRVLSNEHGSYDVVLAIDGGYADRETADAVASSWQDALGRVLDSL